MKNLFRLAGAAIVIMTLGSCGSSQFAITSGNESFDALTKITSGKYPVYNPSGGADGKDVVYSSYEEGGYYNIYMKDNVLTQAIIRKTTGDNYNIRPNFNSATDRITFQYWNNNNYDIYYIGAKSGKAISQVTNTPTNEFNPSWSPDGSQIIFEQGAPPKQFVTVTVMGKQTKSSAFSITQNQLWIKNLTTGELKMIGLGSFPRFSPDGNQVAYISYDVNYSKSGETGTLWVMQTNGENQRQITTAALGYASEPAWSADGKKLAFQLTKTTKTDSDIYTVNVDGENLQQHTTNASNDFSPYWTTDGYIYFCSDRGAKKGDFQIWRFKVSK